MRDSKPTRRFPVVTVALREGPKLVFENPAEYSIREAALEVWEPGRVWNFPLTSVLYWSTEFRAEPEPAAVTALRLAPEPAAA